MFPHRGVHGRSQDHTSCKGEIQRGEEIVREAVGKLSEKIGCCRGDDQNLMLASDRDMLNGRLVITLRPVSAANVSGWINFCAARVMTT